MKKMTTEQAENLLALYKQTCGFIRKALKRHALPAVTEDRHRKAPRRKPRVPGSIPGLSVFKEA